MHRQTYASCQPRDVYRVRSTYQVIPAQVTRREERIQRYQHQRIGALHTYMFPPVDGQKSVGEKREKRRKKEKKKRQVRSGRGGGEKKKKKKKKTTISSSFPKRDSSRGGSRTNRATQPTLWNSGQCSSSL
jgi:hypothetical protein